MGLADAATRKVGPLPAWGWGAVVVGGYLAYRMMSGRSDGTTDAGVPSVGSPIPFDGFGSGGGGGGGGTTPDRLADAVDALREAVTKLPAPGATPAPGTPPAAPGGGSRDGGLLLPGWPNPFSPFPEPRATTPVLIGDQPAFEAPAQWGAAMDLSQISQDTYKLAQQYYYRIKNPDAPRPGGPGPFNQSDANLRQALRDLLIGIVGSGQNYYPVSAYGVIPGDVFSTAQLTPDQLTNFQQTLREGGVTIIPRPEQSAIASGSPPNWTNAFQVNSPGIAAPSTTSVPRSYAAEIATLDKYIANLQADKTQTAEQKKSLQTYIARRAEYAAR